MAWQPEQEPVRELAGYLKDALNAHDQDAQKYATMVRQNASHNLESNHVFTTFVEMNQLKFEYGK